MGANVCQTQKAAYDVAIQEQFNSTGYLSPVEITGGLSIDGNTATITANVELVDAGHNFDAHQVTVFLYDNNVFWCCGYGGADTWNHTVRMVRSNPVTLNDSSSSVEVQESVTIDPEWNAAELHAVAIYEEIGGGLSVIQATNFEPVPYFFVAAFPAQIQSIPDGNGTALFTGVVQNVGETADVVDVAVDGGFGWPTDFQIEGDPTWHTSTSVALGVGEAKEVTIRVQTDSDVRIGTGNFTAESQATAQLHTISPQVFNGSQAILMVDDDGTNTYEQVFLDALDNAGYLYNLYNIGNGGTGPSAAGMGGYDAVIWHTAYSSTTLSTGEVDNLAAYLSNGGGLLLSSMNFTSNQGGHSFTNEYLGVSSYSNSVGALEAYGVSNDPITDGMSFPALFWPVPAANRADEVIPTASASTIFTNEDGRSVALRNTAASGARTVFNTIQMNAFEAGAEDVINASVEWILNGLDPADIEPSTGLPTVTKMLGAFPNPFAPATELSFAVSGREQVSLVLVDASGRQVRTLLNGVVDAGQHQVTWDGNDDSGKSAPNGVYFATLKSASGESIAKLVRVQ